MLILASASPRRHELLQAAAIEHVVPPCAISEERKAGERGTDYVRRIARAKAAAIPCGDGDVVLGADTAVCVERDIFGKPVDDADAMRMLRALAGRDHWVYTGICLRNSSREIVDVSASRVSFLEMSEDEIAEYTRSGEPIDKAGGYAIQGIASRFISRVEGCYQNVVGLPVSLVYRHLKTL